MKRHIAVAVISAMVGAVVALLVSAAASPGKNEATVVVRNESGQLLSGVTVEHEHGRIELGSLAPGKSVAVSVYVPGESSHHVSAQLPSGALLSGQASYLEVGTCVVEVVGPSAIKSESHIHGCGL